VLVLVAGLGLVRLALEPELAVVPEQVPERPGLGLEPEPVLVLVQLALGQVVQLGLVGQQLVPV
jgi:hypothetical protein